MPDLVHHLIAGLAVFGVVFLLNVVPAFAPPTWTVLSFIAIRYQVNVLVLSIVGAVAATSGRLVLARLSRWLVRQRFLGRRTRDNIDEIRKRMEGKKGFTAGAFLLYAFSPFPSNNLFIAYGLTGLPLGLVAIPFLLGRLVSYTFWAFTASQVARVMAYEALANRSFFSYYFILTQALTLLSLYLFAKIDWRKLFNERRLAIFRPNKGAVNESDRPASTPPGGDCQ